MKSFYRHTLKYVCKIPEYLILLILLCFPYGDCKSLNQLLFANEKILRGSREPHRHKFFFATNQFLWYCCNISMDLDTAYSRKLVIAKQFLSSKLQSSVVANKSWSTVLFYYSLFESTRE